MSSAPYLVNGPYLEDLEPGQVLRDAPSVTLTDGLSAAFRSIVGSRLHLVTDQHLSRAVLGCDQVLADPGLVWNIAMGQSTTVTGRVVANLFYRGLRLHRFPVLGDTLTSTTTVTKLRNTTDRPGRAPTGLAQLRIHTTDHQGRTVLDFHRCAMLPRRDTGSRPAVEADVTVVDEAAVPRLSLDTWDLDPWHRRIGPAGADVPSIGTTWRVEAADVVSNAPELARLTMNVARVHHDRFATPGGRRLVYGGHTIGLALHHVVRAIPHLLVIAAWDSCDHTGPVHEGDTLASTVAVVGSTVRDDGVTELALNVITEVVTDDGPPAPVLDWRVRALVATS